MDCFPHSGRVGRVIVSFSRRLDLKRSGQWWPSVLGPAGQTNQTTKKEVKKIMKTDVYEEKSKAQPKSDYRQNASNQNQPADKQEMMKKVEAAGTPGPAHK